MYLEYDKCPERTIKKTRVAYVIISSACTEYVRKFDEWNRSILVTWTLVFWRANYLKLSSRRCKVVFAGCHDGVIEQKVSANPLMRRNPDTSRPCYTAPRPRGSTGEASRQRQEFLHMRNCFQLYVNYHCANEQVPGQKHFIVSNI